MYDEFHSIECLLIALTKSMYEEGCLKNLFLSASQTNSLTIRDICHLCCFAIFGTDKFRFIFASTIQNACRRFLPSRTYSTVQGYAFESSCPDPILKFSDSCVQSKNNFGRCIVVKPNFNLSRGDIVISERPYLVTQSRSCKCCLSPIATEHVFLARALSSAAENDHHEFNTDSYNQFLSSFTSHLPSIVSFLPLEHTPSIPSSNSIDSNNEWAIDIILNMILISVFSSMIPSQLQYHTQDIVSLVSDVDNSPRKHGKTCCPYPTMI